jgi:hypothetical protein
MAYTECGAATARDAEPRRNTVAKAVMDCFMNIAS